MGGLRSRRRHQRQLVERSLNDFRQSGHGLAALVLWEAPGSSAQPEVLATHSTDESGYIFQELSKQKLCTSLSRPPWRYLEVTTFFARKQPPIGPCPTSLPLRGRHDLDNRHSANLAPVITSSCCSCPTARSLALGTVRLDATDLPKIVLSPFSTCSCHAFSILGSEDVSRDFPLTPQSLSPVLYLFLFFLQLRSTSFRLHDSSSSAALRLGSPSYSIASSQHPRYRQPLIQGFPSSCLLTT
jgi:hypothetical protein